MKKKRRKYKVCNQNTFLCMQNSFDIELMRFKELTCLQKLKIKCNFFLWIRNCFPLVFILSFIHSAQQAQFPSSFKTQKLPLKAIYCMSGSSTSVRTLFNAINEIKNQSQNNWKIFDDKRGMKKGAKNKVSLGNETVQGPFMFTQQVMKIVWIA